MTKKLTLLMLVAGHFAFAQQNGIAKYFPAAATGGATPNYANIQELVGGYITPIGEDLGALSNNGWYNTASNHSKWGFDLTVSMNTIFANSDQKTFAPGALSGVVYDGTVPLNNQAPTAYGAETDRPIFHFISGPNSTPLQLAFQGPGGGNITKDVPIGSLIVPTIQGGIGLFGNTDLRFRYTPALKISGVELKNWGVGIQHDIKQHFPGIKMAPFSLSLLVVYSQLTATTDLSGYYTGTGQEGLGETTAYAGQILVSKSLAVLTFYAGLGFNSSTTTYAIKGTYNVDSYENLLGTKSSLNSGVSVTDPFKQEFTSSGFKATGGMRLKFGPVLLNSDYSLVNAKGLFTAGFGFTVR